MNQKPKTKNQKPLLRLCVPVVEPTAARARNRYLRVARKGFWAEIRLDYLEKPDVKKLFRTLPGKVIATNRLVTEGGKWQGTESERLRLLEEALDLGVHFVDVELASDAGWRRELYARRGKTRLILSWHDFSGTPDDESLEQALYRMLAADADIIKMVTLAAKHEDNLRVLSLIPRARAAGREIIAFCMGPLGKWSRVTAPFLGSFLSYAPLSAQKGSAPGQITVKDFRRLWRTLK